MKSVFINLSLVLILGGIGCYIVERNFEINSFTSAAGVGSGIGGMMVILYVLILDRLNTFGILD